MCFALNFFDVNFLVSNLQMTHVFISHALFPGPLWMVIGRVVSPYSGLMMGWTQGQSWCNGKQRWTSTTMLTHSTTVSCTPRVSGVWYVMRNGDNFGCGVFGLLISAAERKTALTHWGRDKMDAIFQTTFSSEFSRMKMDKFRLRFHWNLFLGFELTIFHHWFR